PHTPPPLNRIKTASTGSICPCLRRVAGCAPPTGSAGHASATASLKLTFHLDHSVGANQPRAYRWRPVASPVGERARPQARVSGRPALQRNGTRWQRCARPRNPIPPTPSGTAHVLAPPPRAIGR